MTEEVKEEVEQFIRSGEREKALQYLQNSFNVSEQDAILLVEALEREIGIHSQTPAAPPTTASPGTIRNEIAEMLRAGRKLEAVVYIRQQLHLGLKDTLVMVQDVGREVNPNQFSFNLAGCLQLVAKGVGVFLMIVSIMFLVAAGIIYFIQYQSISNSDRVEGVIKEMKQDQNGAFAPVVGFEWQGQQRSYESTFYASPPDYTAGERVFVFVNRDDPENIVIDTFGERWAIIVGLSVPGALLLAVSIVFLHFGKRKF